MESGYRGPDTRSGNDQPPRGILAALLLPLAQAGLTGFLFGILILSGYNAFTRPGIWTITGFITAGIILFVYWNFTGAVNDFFWGIEEALQMDIDNNGMIGQPEPEPQPARILRIELAEGNKRRFYDFWDDQRIVQFALYVTDTGDLSHRAIVGAGLYNDSEYAAIRSYLLKGGLISQRNGNPKDGYQLTRAGRAVFERIAAPYRTEPQTLPAV